MYWKVDGFLIAFPLLAYGFTSQQFVFGVYQSLRTPTIQRMTSVVKQVGPSSLSTGARASSVSLGRPWSLRAYVLAVSEPPSSLARRR